MTLPRRGYFGLQPADDVVGVYVAALVPDGPAALGGVCPGDRVLALDDVPVRSARAVRDHLGQLREHDIVRWTVRHDGHDRVVALVAPARPLETWEGLGLRVGVAYSGSTRLRTLAVAPASPGPWPCVCFLQGYACGSVERPAGAASGDALRELVVALVRAGYCVWRTEKRGAGDSDGPSCHDASFCDETDDHAAGVAAALDSPAIDSNRVFLFGHSLGALHAPLVASRVGGVRAMALYGAGTLPWLDYLDATARRQCALAGLDAETAARRVALRRRFFEAVIVEGRSVREVFARDPALAAEPRLLGVDDAMRIDEHSETYWRGVQGCVVAPTIAAAGVPVLAMWGSADWLTTREEHVDLAAMAEASGRGRFVEVEGADHGFFAHASMAASYASGWRGRFQPRVADALLSWLREHA